MTTVSFAGLDLSFMKRNPLPKREKIVFRRPDKRSTKVSAPYFMRDIAEFVSVVGEDNEVISSRSKLREHEKKHNCYQVGNDFGAPGTIGAKNELKKQQLQERAERAQKVGVSLDWT